MTQVTSLNAGMGTSVRTNAASKQESQKDLLAEFAGIMNQNAHNLFQTSDGFEDHMSSMTDRKATVDGSTDAFEKDYAKFGSPVRKIDQAQTQRPGSEADMQKVQELTGQVKESVQETMQVSEEEVEQAMETLGLGMLDLLLPQNLIRLVQELTGNTEVGALLTDGNFQAMMQEVTGLITGFQQDNGLNTAQFSDLLAQLSAQVDELEEKVKALLNLDGSEQTTPQQTAGMQEISESMAEQMPEGQMAAVAVEEQPQMQTVQDQLQNNPQNESVQTGALEPDQTTAMAVEELPEEFAQTKDQGENAMSQGDMNKQQSQMQTDERKTVTAEHHAGMFGERAAVMNEQTIAAAPETLQTSQTYSYVELDHLMNQLEGLARTFASAAGTTVEMQLNPENLGRLVLSVTEKHGNVTAQITASNEQVREALQTQMVELRSTLQAQGIKVEAVEVTVATHEFEQNLDGNTSANGQMQEQAGGQHAGNGNGRRNFHRNSLDELSGLMSEEEALVAQMMRDNGGTVDFTA